MSIGANEVEATIRKRGRSTPGRYLRDTPLGTGGLADHMINPPMFQVSYRGNLSGIEQIIQQKVVA